MNSKILLRSLVVILAGLLPVVYLVALKQGRSAGYKQAAGILREAGFVTSFDVLKKLRAGEYTNAVERLELFCYSTAADLWEQPGAESNLVVLLYQRDLAHYRSTYARASGEKYPTEERLDRLLGENQRRAGAVSNQSEIPPR